MRLDHLLSMEKKDGALRGAVQNSDREENAYTITVYAKRKKNSEGRELELRRRDDRDVAAV